MIAVSYKINTYVLEARKADVTARNEYSKKLIRIIMSKNELMQSWNHDYETARLDIETDNMIAANIGKNPYLHRMFTAPKIILNIVRIVVFLLVGTAYFQ